VFAQGAITSTGRATRLPRIIEHFGVEHTGSIVHFFLFFFPFPFFAAVADIINKPKP